MELKKRNIITTLIICSSFLMPSLSVYSISNGNNTNISNGRNTSSDGGTCNIKNEMVKTREEELIKLSKDEFNLFIDGASESLDKIINYKYKSCIGTTLNNNEERIQVLGINDIKNKTYFSKIKNLEIYEKDGITYLKKGDKSVKSKDQSVYPNDSLINIPRLTDKDLIFMYFDAFKNKEGTTILRLKKEISKEEFIALNSKINIVKTMRFKNISSLKALNLIFDSKNTISNVEVISKIGMGEAKGTLTLRQLIIEVNKQEPIEIPQDALRAKYLN